MENTFTLELQLIAELHGYNLNSFLGRDYAIKILGAQKNIAPNKADKINPTLTYFSKGKANGVMPPLYKYEGRIFIHSIEGTNRHKFTQFMYCQN